GVGTSFRQRGRRVAAESSRVKSWRLRESRTSGKAPRGETVKSRWTRDWAQRQGRRVRAPLVGLADPGERNPWRECLQATPFRGWYLTPLGGTTIEQACVSGGRY